jgi:replicative DNA helicase
MQDIRSILNIALKLTEKHNDLVETGFETIDKILNGGFEKGEVTLLAAAPSVGKSTFAINVFSNECEKLAYTP